MDEFVTRAAALAAGAATYFTGKPCKHGHIAARYTANWTCVTCHNARCAAALPGWRAKNPEKVAASRKRVAERHSVTSKAWRLANPDKTATHRRDWNAKNKEKRNLLSKEWRQRNKGVMNAHKAKRKSDILRRMPPWLTADDKWMMREAYTLAALRTKLTGVQWHVDHIIPLRGKKVSGLHVPDNLQVIPASVNQRKWNFYDAG